MIKEYTLAVAGRVDGLWNKETKSFEVKRGMTANGKKYQIFEISVSAKDKEDNWTNGKGLKVMMWGETKIEAGTVVGIKGKLQPDNWTNSEGKEIRGLMVNAFADDMFTPEKWEGKGDESGKSQPKTQDVW